MTGIYARQSVDKKDSISVETQIELCRSRCGGSEVKVYTDRGFSGRNLKRPAYLAMMRDMSKGVIDKVIVYRLDRLSRSVSDFSRMWEIFEQYNVEFSSISEQFDTSTPIGKAMVYIIMTFAQLERETIAERITDNYYSRVKTGAWPGGKAPFGFRNARIVSGGHSIPTLEPNEYAESAARIFAEYAYTDKSLAVIAKEFSKNGVPSSPSRPLGWDSKSLSRILRSPVYTSADQSVLSYYKQLGIGTISNGDEEFDGTFSAHLVGKRSAKSSSKNPPSLQTLSLTNFSGIVDSETWLKCQRKLDQNHPVNSARRNSPTWLSGLLKCASCGYAVSIKKAGDRRYLCCSGRYNLHLCSVRSMTAKIEDLEQIIEKEITDLFDVCIQTVKDGRSQLHRIDEEIGSLIENCSHASALTMKYINEKISVLEKQKRTLQECFLSDSSMESRFPAPAIPRLGFQQKKDTASLLIDRIEISGRKIDIYWKKL